MKTRNNLKILNDYDLFISIKIPDKEKYCGLHLKHMFHGSCGELKKSCPSMIEGNVIFIILFFHGTH